MKKTDQTSIRFVSMNLNGMSKYGWDERKDLNIQVFRFLQGHIFGAQEFPYQDLAEFQKVRPEIDWLLSKEMKDICNAIGFDKNRFSVEEYDTVVLSPNGELEKCWRGSKRCMIFAILNDLETGQKIQVVNFHIDHKSKQARENGMKLIIDHLNHSSEIPTLVTADMNMSPNSPSSKWHKPTMLDPYRSLLRAGYRDCFRKKKTGRGLGPYTYQGFKGKKYLRPDKFGTWDTDLNAVSHHFDILSSEVIDCSIAGQSSSDHDYVASTVCLIT